MLYKKLENPKIQIFVHVFKGYMLYEKMYRKLPLTSASMLLDLC